MTDLAVQDLTVTYGHGRDAAPAVKQVGFELPSGSTLGLVGESGCGKTSIGRALVGVGDCRGTVTLDGVAHQFGTRSARSALRSSVQIVFQNPMASLNPRLPVQQSVADGVRARLKREHRPVAGALRAEVSELLAMVGLEDVTATVYPHELSGGQCQRVALARALGSRPAVLIADEITSALDVSVQAQVLNMLRSLQASLGFSCLFISHDLAAVRYMSTSIAVMYLGRVVESGRAADVLATPRHPYSQSLLESSTLRVIEDRELGEIPDIRRPPSGCAFHPRCPQGPAIRPDHERCGRDLPVLTSGRQPVACHFPLTDDSVLAQPADRSL